MAAVAIELPRTDRGTAAPQRGQAARESIHPQALTPEEKQAIVQVCNTPEHASLPPSQILPRLAAQGRYLASESSFYRVLKEHGQINRRGKAQPPKKVAAPQVWVVLTHLKLHSQAADG